MGLGHKGTTKSGGQKDSLDRFYTSAAEAERLVQLIEADLPHLVIEPSAGQGSFVAALEQRRDAVLAYDIDPDANLVCSTPVAKADFLRLSVADIRAAYPEYAYDDTAFVGNPPFGVQGRLAIQFVHHCLDLASDVWMILPPSFRKRSMADKIGNGELVQVYPLHDTTYTTPVGVVNVPSFMMHWHACDGREAYRRRRQEEQSALATLPFDFISWKNCDSVDIDKMFSIRRVGGSSGHASESTNVSPQSNYLCCVKNGYSRADIIKWINQTEFPEREWSVGPRSLSKGEIALRLVQNPM